jgi:transcriptional regulator with XRE-family HTH domain
MNFEEMIKSLYPDLNNQMSSRQYELSEKIIKLKLKNNYTQSQMAKLMEVNFVKYIQMEMSETNVSIEEYEQALNIFEENNALAEQLLSNTEEVVRYPNYIFQDEETTLQDNVENDYLNVYPNSNYSTTYNLVEDIYPIDYNEMLVSLNWYEKVSKHTSPIYSKVFESKLNITNHMNHTSIKSFGNLINFKDVEADSVETELLVVNV